jgi:hypothetical protein
VPRFDGGIVKRIGDALLERFAGIADSYKLSHEIRLLLSVGYAERSSGTRTPKDQVGRLALFGLHRS